MSTAQVIDFAQELAPWAFAGVLVVRHSLASYQSASQIRQDRQEKAKRKGTSQSPDEDGEDAEEPPNLYPGSGVLIVAYVLLAALCYGSRYLTPKTKDGGMIAESTDLPAEVLEKLQQSPTPGFNVMMPNSPQDKSEAPFGAGVPDRGGKGRSFFDDDDALDGAIYTHGGSLEPNDPWVVGDELVGDPAKPLTRDEMAVLAKKLLQMARDFSSPNMQPTSYIEKASQGQDANGVLQRATEAIRDGNAPEEVTKLKADIEKQLAELRAVLAKSGEKVGDAGTERQVPEKRRLEPVERD